MSQTSAEFSATARKAAQSKDWGTVSACAGEILRLRRRESRGLLPCRPGGQSGPATATRPAEAFAKALALDSPVVMMQRSSSRAYTASPAAMRRRTPCCRTMSRAFPQQPALSRHGRVGLFPPSDCMKGRCRCTGKPTNSSQASQVFQANLAACDVYLGNIEEATSFLTGCCWSGFRRISVITTSSRAWKRATDSVARRADEVGTSLHEPAAGKEHLHLLRDW